MTFCKRCRFLHVCVKTTGLTMTCVLHVNVSEKVLLLCQSTFEAKPKGTAVEKAACHLMEMLVTHSGQLLQACFYGGAFIWFSASSWGPSCCLFSLISLVIALPFLMLQGLPALRKGRVSLLGKVFIPVDSIPPSALKEISCASKIPSVWVEKQACFQGFI